MVLGLILSGGIPYLEKDDNVEATFTIAHFVEITWQGKRFGQRLAFKRTYDLDIHKYVSDVYNMFFKELSNHLREIKEIYYLYNCVVPPSLFDKPDQATLNEILTKSALHLMNAPEPTGVRPISSLIGGEYEKPWIFKDCANTECVRYIATHETDGTGGI